MNWDIVIRYAEYFIVLAGLVYCSLKLKSYFKELMTKRNEPEIKSNYALEKYEELQRAKEQTK